MRVSCPSRRGMVGRRAGQEAWRDLTIGIRSYRAELALERCRHSVVCVVGMGTMHKAQMGFLDGLRWMGSFWRHSSLINS